MSFTFVKWCPEWKLNIQCQGVADFAQITETFSHLYRVSTALAQVCLKQINRY